MKILIVGLGLIGGSYAKGLIKKGYEVYGIDTNKETRDFALKNKIVTAVSDNPLSFINDVDVLILGLYPNDIIDFLNKYSPYFSNDLIITDVCGIKTSFVYKVNDVLKHGEYISHHPMAGREKIGITYADEKIFKGANFLVTPINNSKRAIDTIMQIGKDLEFGKFFIMTPEHHDQMIAFTSQLTHAIAVSLVNSDHNLDTKNYIGDSYRDLTRIAMINENLWSELFMENKSYLLAQIAEFEAELNLLKDALANNNSNQLKELFINSRKKRSGMEK